MEIPVYLFTGFLESGKTTFIQGTLEDEKFDTSIPTLVIICEEGITEYDQSKFKVKNVTLEIIENEEDLNSKKLDELVKHSNAQRIMIEYNGMWQLNNLFTSFNDNYIVYQEVCFFDSTTFLTYNQNIRSLVYDKINTADLIVFNRFDGSDDTMTEFHKIVRGVSRRADIIYEDTDGNTRLDEIEDPLPFDKNAKVIEIKAEDYALWYADISEKTNDYKNKIINFTGLVAKDKGMQKNQFAIGRHVMTCCVDDIQYAGIVAFHQKASELTTGTWVNITGKIKIEYDKIYDGEGPILYVKDYKVCPPIEPAVATMY